MELLPQFASRRDDDDIRHLLNQIHHCDAMDLLRRLPDASVDLIATDPPYNTTACSFESDIALRQVFWDEVWRVMKPNCAVVMTGCQPFTTYLIQRNMQYFRHNWVWEKSRATGYLNANRMPMKAHEDVIVFGNGAVAYYPQMTSGKPYSATRGAVGEHVHDKTVGGYVTQNTGKRYPRTVLKINSVSSPDHETQKPLELMRYLIQTYSKANDIVLDMFCGSGTTVDAARQLDRQFIASDFNASWVEYTKRRISKPYTLSLFDIA